MNFLLLLLLASLFLIKIPPFYLFYPLPYSFLTTHTLARVLIVLLLAIFIWDAFSKNKPLVVDKNKGIFFLFLIYFLFQSISIFGATTVTSFLQRYKDIVFPGIFLLLVFKFKDKSEKIIYVFLATAVFNFFYQMFMFFAPNLFKEFASLFIYKDHFDLVYINLQRSRLFIETYDEVAIPFLFMSLSQAKTQRHKLIIFGIFLIILIPSLLSNFRSRILMLAFALIASFFLLAKKELLVKVNFIVLTLIAGYLAVFMLNSLFGYSFIDRLTLQDKKEDVKTVELRFSNLMTSVQMALSKPFYGVGLGNYYDNLSFDKKIRMSFFGWKEKESEIASTNPHDIFAQIMAETGLISMFFYLFMLVYFFIGDIKMIIAGNKPQTSFIISFWTLFLYSIFNPTTTLTYNLLFWLFRGLISL